MRLSLVRPDRRHPRAHGRRWTDRGPDWAHLLALLTVLVGSFVVLLALLRAVLEKLP